jgi:Fis family transcriptional regulator
MSIDVLLAKELKKHLPKISTMRNGGLHKMVIGLVEKSLVKIVLDETNGNQTDASRILGINRNTLRKKMKDYKIQN